MKKKILTSLIIASISLSSSIPVFAQGYNGDRYAPQNENKTYTFSDINRGIGPVRLGFHGWKEIDGKTFYFDENGKMVTGLIKIDGKLYYFNDLGELQLGLTYLNIPCRGYEIYYFDKDTGAVTNKWETVNGKKYYFNSEGLGYSNEVAKIDGKLYAFTRDGSLDTTTNGSAVLHSVVPGTDIHEYYTYFLEGGVVQTGWHIGYYVIKGEVYKAYDIQYYSPDTGAMVHGWQKIDGKTYYFRSSSVAESDGTMVRGIQTIDGKTYDFGSDGALIGEVSK